MVTLPRYAELHCLSNFSFLKGASHPEELVIRATELGYAALAITDECSLAGVVRAHTEARSNDGLKLIIGSSFILEDGLQLVLIALNREGYGNLSELITLGRMRCEKGSYRLTRADFDGSPQPADRIPEAAGTIDHLAGMRDCIALWIPSPAKSDDELEADARWFASTFPLRERPDKPPKNFDPRRAWIAVQRSHRMDDKLVVTRMTGLAERMRLPCVATGNVHMHLRSRKPLQDSLTAIRLNQSVAECGDALAPNAERHLRTRTRLARLFTDSMLEATVTIADQCEFSLKELGYQYPKEIVPEGETQTSYLRKLTEEGLVTRFPPNVVATLAEGRLDKVLQQIEHELKLIAELRYEAFFLTVYDIVKYARSVGILCQGRGSAANSAVCFCLGITEVNPALQETLFERFLTKERNEPPDIDVDFEHQRREEVIQYIFNKYGRHRTALAATVIAYRTRSAIRDVGRALGFDGERIDRLSKSHAWWDGGQEARERLEENGFDPDSPMVRKLIELTATLRGFPRHLSQHVGGFVISADKLSRMVPIENAAMERPKDWDDEAGHRAMYEGARNTIEDGQVSDQDSDATRLTIHDETANRWAIAAASRRVPRDKSALFPTFRSVIQWDKDDLEELGLLKVDVLALGMLSAMRRALELCSQRHGRPFRMIDVPQDDPDVYEMICKADTVGVFQIESRAQMSMLPRLRPRNFYDLVVEVAIVRPGPIQGGMVHPYLKAREAQRQGKLPDYPQPGAKEALERTLGVPIFQEQVMQLMMLAADFSAGEADKLRRAMAAWKRKGGLGPFRDRIVEGMVKNKYEREYAERIFKQVEGFGEYGFPESHAASFAFLVYISSWIKHHEPAAFLAAMLNSQPLGFYSSSQLIQDAKRHGVEVRPIDVTISEWDATLEEVESEVEFQARVARGRLEAGSTWAAEATAEMDTSLTMDALVDANTTFEGVVQHRIKRKQSAVRLGLNSINALNSAAALRLLAARSQQPFESIDDLGRRSALSTVELEALAVADALAPIAGIRRQALWQAASHRLQSDLLRDASFEEVQPILPVASEGNEIVADYASTGFTLRRHPLALLRPRLQSMGLLSARDLHDMPNGRFVCTTGLVTVRQRPGTAKGTIFVTLEDETGVINVIVWGHVIASQRRAMLSSRLLTTCGAWQREGEVRHLIANQFFDHSDLIGSLSIESRDFH
jgi:error-prone DNA polymerase